MRKIILKAGGVLYDDNFFYIVYRENHNDYSLPKGRLEDGESLRSCALREVQEETNIKAEIVSYCGEVIYTTKNLDSHQTTIIIFYVMKAIEHLTTPLADDVSRVIKIQRNDPNLLKIFTYETDKTLLSKAIRIIQNQKLI